MRTGHKKVIYFVRHGQSVHNVSPVFQADDAPLSDTGIKQAKSIADRLSTLQFETLISSPLLRAAETAQHISKQVKKDIIFSDIFVERSKPSAINGKPYSDSEARQKWKEWEESLYTPGMRIDDGENYDDLIIRADKALAFLEARSESTLTVVTHGYFLRMLVARVLIGQNLTGSILRDFQRKTFLENTAITVLYYTDGFKEEVAWRLWTLNDHSHFAE